MDNVIYKNVISLTLIIFTLFRVKSLKFNFFKNIKKTNTKINIEIKMY